MVCRSSVLRRAMVDNCHKVDDTAGFLEYVKGLADSEIDFVADLKAFIRTNVNSRARFVRAFSLQ